MLSLDSLCYSFKCHSLGKNVADRQQLNPDVMHATAEPATSTRWKCIPASNLMQGDLHVFDQLPLAVALWRMFAKRRRTNRLVLFQYGILQKSYSSPAGSLFPIALCHAAQLIQRHARFHGHTEINGRKLSHVSNILLRRRRRHWRHKIIDN